MSEVKVVIPNTFDWEASELKLVERKLGPISPSNTYKAVILSRTPGGTRWYAWWRPRSKSWLAVSNNLKDLIEGVKEKLGERAR